MSNFAYVLMAGTALLVIGGLLAGMSDAPGAEVRYDDENTSQGEVYQKDLGVIGTIEQSSRVVELGDITVEKRPPNQSVASFDEVTVSKGVFGEGDQQVVTFNARKPRSIFIDFTVADANPAKELKFVLNGHEETSMNPEPGQSYTVRIANVSEGRNTLLLETESPGLKFWSSTRYDLQDVDVILNDETFTKSLETFRVYPYELDGFDEGILRFDVNEDAVTQDPLRIDINDQNIVSERASKRTLTRTRKFSAQKTGLRPGENTVTFYTREGSMYPLSNVELEIVYYLSEQQRTFKDTFTIPRLDYEAFRGGKEGRIGFTVRKIGVREPVTMKLNDRTYTIEPSPGRNTVSFDRSDVNSGKNSISLTTSGNYEITDFRIQIANFGT